MKIYFFTFIIASTFWSLLCRGDSIDKCINNPEEGPVSDILNVQFAEADDPLIRQFREEKKKEEEKKKHILECTAESHPVVMDTIKEIQKITKYKTRIKKECIEGALQRMPGNGGLLCGKDKTAIIKNSKVVAEIVTINEKKETKKLKTPQALCYGQEIVDYIHFAVNQSISCISSVAATPVNPRYLLKKLNNETGFNTFISYSGGKGISQVTSPAVKEMTGWYDKRSKKWITGYGFQVFEKIISSNNPACSAFKEIIQDDIKNPKHPAPPYATSDNACTWTAIDHGLARNLIYGLGYYVYVRDSLVAKRLKNKFGKNHFSITDGDILNNLALESYGHDGFDSAEIIIKSLRKNYKKPKQMLTEIQDDSLYLKETNTQMESLLKILNADDPIYDSEGYKCIE